MSDITRAAAVRPMRREDVFSTDERIPAGGARRDRTDDLLLAKQALSQLSYGPDRNQKSGIRYQEQRLVS